jgi:hypothetical protein
LRDNAIDPMVTVTENVDRQSGDRFRSGFDGGRITIDGDDASALGQFARQCDRMASGPERAID